MLTGWVRLDEGLLSWRSWREFLAGTVGHGRLRGPSLRHAIPRGFVQDDKIGEAVRAGGLSQKPPEGGEGFSRPPGG
jgi:hypothetical protein